MINFLYTFLICFIFALILSPIIIALLQKLKTGQNILSYVESHQKKQGTLSMGGAIFVLSSFVSVLFMSGNLILGILSLVISFCYALVGFLDDFLKIKLKHNEGLKPYQKIIGQVGVAVIVSIFIYNYGWLGGVLYVPFTTFYINIGWWIIPLSIIFFIAVTNSVNLTDGLDGLAGYVSVVVIFTLGVIAIIKYNNATDLMLNQNIIMSYYNIALACFGYGGAIFVFLLFNTHPARIFMGDTGSLAIGGFIASVTAFMQEYLLMLVIGIMFVVTAVSDILQVGYYKLTKKRIFLMAPFHHHLERKGVFETKIVGLYVIITLVLCISTVFVYLSIY